LFVALSKVTVNVSPAFNPTPPPVFSAKTLIILGAMGAEEKLPVLATVPTAVLTCTPVVSLIFASGEIVIRSPTTNGSAGILFIVMVSTVADVQVATLFVPKLCPSFNINQLFKFAELILILFISLVKVMVIVSFIDKPGELPLSAATILKIAGPDEKLPELAGLLETDSKVVLVTSLRFASLAMVTLSPITKVVPVMLLKVMVRALPAEFQTISELARLVPKLCPLVKRSKTLIVLAVIGGLFVI
jgi:hypothetical protein